MTHPQGYNKAKGIIMKKAQKEHVTFAKSLIIIEKSSRNDMEEQFRKSTLKASKKDVRLIQPIVYSFSLREVLFLSSFSSLPSSLFLSPSHSSPLYIMTRQLCCS
ncbi:unnamed protein product [Brassica napus]|uniref:(rape) hypothetical protein n=1 Tax=Brassica napus TaxID=3708 RepID=A0A816V1N2_BRANA|nr:unnamed protein product [Brassica napus]